MIAKFKNNQSGFIAISTAILMPVIIGLIYLAYDGGKILSQYSKLDDITREANLAAGLSDANVTDIKELVNEYLKYFLNKDSKIKVENLGSFSDENKTLQKQSQRLSLSLSDFTILVPFKDELSNQYNINILSDIIKGGEDNGYTDYAFAIDFTASMLNKNQSLNYNQIDQECQKANKDSDEFDTNFCEELKNATTNLQISQAITRKILKILAKYNSDTVSYSIIPLASLLQVDRSYDYTLGRQNPGAKQLVTPYILRSRYKLDDMQDYDYMSTKFNKVISQGSFSLPEDGLNANERRKALRIQDLLNEMADARSNYFEGQFSTIVDLKDIIDIKSSIDNMFDLNAGFGFRLNANDNNNPIVYFYDRNSRENEIKTFTRIEGLTALNTKNNPTDLLASETPLKSLKSITDYNDNPIIDRNDEITLNPNNQVALNSMSVVPGIMRAAAHLARGSQSRKVLIMITDGNTNNGNSGGVTKLEKSFIIDNQLCQRIQDGLLSKGASEVKIVSIVIGDKSSNKDFYNLMKSCTEEKNIIFVNDIKTFFKEFIGATKGNGTNTRFRYEPIEKK